MEKKSYDIIFNLKNNPSVSLREINKLLVDIRKNTQEMATDVSRQISAVQSPVDGLRAKWLGLTGGMGASLALLSENASGITLMSKGLNTLLTSVNSTATGTKILNGIIAASPWVMAATAATALAVCIYKFCSGSSDSAKAQ